MRNNLKIKETSIGNLYNILSHVNIEYTLSWLSYLQFPRLSKFSWYLFYRSLNLWNFLPQFNSFRFSSVSSYSFYSPFFPLSVSSPFRFQVTNKNAYQELYVNLSCNSPIMQTNYRSLFLSTSLSLALALCSLLFYLFHFPLSASRGFLFVSLLRLQWNTKTKNIPNLRSSSRTGDKVANHQNPEQCPLFHENNQY